MKIRIQEDGQLSFSALSVNNIENLPTPDLPHYELITEYERLTEIIPDLKRTKYLGVDCETSGLDPLTDRMRILQLAVSPDMVYILDLYKLDNLDCLKNVFASESPVKIFHNAVFDQKFLIHHYALRTGTVYDTMLANKLLYNGLGYRNSLQEVVKEEMGLFLDKGLQSSMWDTENLMDEQLQYAALDAAILITLRAKQVPKLVEQRLVQAAKIEFDCTRATTAMSLAGMPVDMVLLDTLLEEAERSLAEEEERALVFFPGCNLNSSAQVLPVLARSGIFPASLQETELRQFKESSPAIRSLLEYKSGKKMADTLLGIKNYVHPLTGRIHADYNQFGAASGRMSSFEPNLQSIPRGDLRRIFAAPEGRSLIVADYGQIELRIIAEISKDPVLRQAFLDGKDIHNMTAANITGKPLEEISKDDRQKAKAVNFGLVYGMGAAGLVRYAGNAFNVEMSLEEAEITSHRFFQTYSGIKDWHTQIKRNADKIEFLETLSGRKRYYPDSERYYSELFNTPVQGTGADILKIALTRLDNIFSGTKTYLCNAVHDEIIIETDSEQAESVAQIVEREMVEAGRTFIKSVPIAVNVDIARNWA